MKEILLYFQAFFYFLAGVNHFRRERFYLKMMPDYITRDKQAVFWTGLAEICLAIGLVFIETRSLAAWGIIILLILVFPANINMLTSGKFQKIPKWFLIGRLPFQFLLIWWAYYYT